MQKVNFWLRHQKSWWLSSSINKIIKKILCNCYWTHLKMNTWANDTLKFIKLSDNIWMHGTISSSTFEASRKRICLFYLASSFLKQHLSRQHQVYRRWGLTFGTRLQSLVGTPEKIWKREEKENDILE